MSTLYRLNVDFDNSVVPFLYEDTGSYTFTVPMSPNFMGSRYVVFLPAVMILNDVSKIPAISGYTRVEGVPPSSGEWRTIASANYEILLLKDAIEFHSSAAGATLTITNFWTIGSVVDPAQMVAESARDENRKGLGFYTRKSTGIDMDLSYGELRHGKGFIKVIDTPVYKTSEGTYTPPAQLTAGRWHVVYINESGVVSVEEMSSATDYTAFPLSALDTSAPVNAEGNARYKSGDSTKRAVAVAYSLPTQSTYAVGTTYARGNVVRFLDGAVYKNYVSRVDSNIGNTPNSSPTKWLKMGTEGYLFSPKIYNLPEETFGTGALGDVTLDGTGAGATGTPLYGLRENVTGTIQYYPEYEFNNLTITGTVYCGKSDGLSLDPVVIRVKGTLTIGASGQLNGNSRGANGGAGGTANAGTSQAIGGAGGKSGRPIHIFANKIINRKTSGSWITTSAGNGSAGVLSSDSTRVSGGGGASSSGLIIITNSSVNEFLSGVNKNIHSNPGAGAQYSTKFGCSGGDFFGSKSHGLSESSGSIGYFTGTSNRGVGGVGGIVIGGGGGAGAGGGGAGVDPTDGSAPSISHLTLGYVIIMDNFISRLAV